MSAHLAPRLRKLTLKVTLSDQSLVFDPAISREIVTLVELNINLSSS